MWWNSTTQLLLRWKTAISLHLLPLHWRSLTTDSFRSIYNNVNLRYKIVTGQKREITCANFATKSHETFFVRISKPETVLHPHTHTYFLLSCYIFLHYKP